MHWTDNLLNWVFFNWKVFGNKEEEEDEGVCWVVEGEEEAVEEVSTDKKRSEESYITFKSSPELRMEINSRINGQISL